MVVGELLETIIITGEGVCSRVYVPKTLLLLMMMMRFNLFVINLQIPNKIDGRAAQRKIEREIERQRQNKRLKDTHGMHKINKLHYKTACSLSTKLTLKEWKISIADKRNQNEWVE